MPRIREITALHATPITPAPLHWAAMTPRRDMFPPIEPYRTGQLRLDSRHVMYWEESGNPEGPPIVFLHGGPGAGGTPVHRRGFVAQAFRSGLFLYAAAPPPTPPPRAPR